ncbi:hypothetical protein NEOC95_000566 [Neochlamydia sp. AcF95]|nr:hypothetical protein [Neochlamydia sp. AcF95]
MTYLPSEKALSALQAAIAAQTDLFPLKRNKTILSVKSFNLISPYLSFL